MLNREIYQKDPSTRKLVNEGVASVNDEKTNQALSVLRYELDTFVCDGQYEKGLVHILETYLKNIEQAEQPAVWVSGFYGSGKSHLVKMLRALWVDSAFDDGATARGIATLPPSVSDQLKALTIQAKRHGGLHAASGTLGSSSRDKSVRMALLGVLFKSAMVMSSRLTDWMHSSSSERARCSGLDISSTARNVNLSTRASSDMDVRVAELIRSTKCLLFF